MATTKQVALWGGTTILLAAGGYAVTKTSPYTRPSFSCPASAAAAKCDTTAECPANMVCTYDVNPDLRPIMDAEGITTFGHCVQATVESSTCSSTNAIEADLAALESVNQSTAVSGHWANQAIGIPYRLPPSATLYFTDPESDGIILTVDKRLSIDCQGAQLLTPINTTAINVNPLAQGGTIRNCGFRRTTTASHSGVDILDKAPNFIIENIVSDHAGTGIQMVTSTGVTTNDGAMTNGSAVLTSASGPFLSTDVGLNIGVAGANAAGGTLLANVVSYQSATQVTLDRPAGTTVSGKLVTIYRGGNVNASRILRPRIYNAYSYGIKIDGGDANNVIIDGPSIEGCATAIYESSFLGGLISGPHLEGNTTALKIDDNGATTVVGSYIEISDAVDVNNTNATYVGGIAPCRVENAAANGDRIGQGCAALHFKQTYSGSTVLVTIPVVSSLVKDFAEMSITGGPTWQWRANAGAGTDMDFYSPTSPAGSRLLAAAASVSATVNSQGVARAITCAALAIDHGSISAGATLEATATCTGAAANDIVRCSPRAALPAGLVHASDRASATNTVAVSLANITAGAIDPASITWDCLDGKP